MAKSKKRSDSSVTGQVLSESRARVDGNNNPSYDRDRVAQRAYELYLARGGTHGSDWDDWLAAERELMNARTGDRRRRGDEEKR